MGAFEGGWTLIWLQKKLDTIPVSVCMKLAICIDLTSNRLNKQGSTVSHVVVCNFNNNFVCWKIIFYQFWILVRGTRPGKNVQLTESEIRGLCLKSRELFLSQPILLELEAPLKICGMYIDNVPCFSQSRCSVIELLRN